MRRIQLCIIASFANFYSEYAFTILCSFFFFFFSVLEFSILNSPLFLVVSFAEEDEVDEDDEVGEGLGQV